MRVVRRRPVAVLAATVLGLGVLSGCGGEASDEPSTATSTASPIPVDPSTSSSSSSSSPGSSSSSTKGEGSVDLPEAATKHTQDGAVAFAKFYWDATGRALHMGETRVLEELSTDCVPCDEYVSLIQEDAEKGLHADINPTVIGEDKVTDETDGKSAQAVTLTVQEKSYELVDDEGESHGVADPVKYDIIIYLDQVPSGWTVVDLYMLT